MFETIKKQIKKVIASKSRPVVKKVTTLKSKPTVNKVIRMANKATIEKAKAYYLKGDHKSLAAMLPHLRDEKHPFITKLNDSRLLFLGKELEKEALPFTLGADPEFILKNDKGDVVLFSSEMSNTIFTLASASIGADYGLLEFRLPYRTTVYALINILDGHTRTFEERYEDKNISIMEKEAIIFNHKIARTRQQLDNEKIDFGVNIDKYFTATQNIDLDDETSYNNVSLSAYDEPVFAPSRPDLLTAGGHIHIGGTLIRMMSMQQLKLYIKTIDKKIEPIYKAIETPAATLRRQAYGFPGEFRVKPYGVEYRTLSNAIFWKKNRKALKAVLEIMEKEARSFFLN